MDAKVTVEEMIAAIEVAENATAFPKVRIGLTAARRYILAAESQIAKMQKVIQLVRDGLWARRGDIACICVPGSYDCPLHAILGAVGLIDQLGLTEANDGNK